MMKKFCFLFLIGLLISGCTSSQETQSLNKSGVEYYVFDNVEKLDSIDNGIEKLDEIKKDTLRQEKDFQQSKDSLSFSKYIIQLGAFSTKERAENFIKENQSKISYMMSVIYNLQSKLFVVQLPPFKERSEAEMIKNTLWKISVFKDAFIVSE